MGSIIGSVTRLGNLLYFGQLFKACGNHYFVQIAHIFSEICKVVKIFNFCSEIIFGQLFSTFGDFLQVTLMVTSKFYFEEYELALPTKICHILAIHIAKQNYKWI